MTRRTIICGHPCGICGWALGAALSALAVAAAASDYPPPPGTYQVEPLELPQPVATGEAARTLPNSSAGMLPLPGPGDAADDGTYAADRLFGSAPPTVPAAVLRPGQAPPTADAPASTGTTHPQGVPAPLPVYGSADRPPVAPAWQGQVPNAPAYPAYPAYREPPAFGGFRGGYGGYPTAGFGANGYPRDTPMPAQYPASPPDYAAGARDAAGYAPGYTQGYFPPQTPPAADAPGEAQAPWFQPRPDSGLSVPPAAPARDTADDALFRPPMAAPYR